MGRGIHDETKRLVDAAFGILGAEQPMTLRQLFYRMVSLELILNEQRAYKRVIDHVGKARERGVIPWEWIVDRSRPVCSHAGWDGIEEYGEPVAEAYRRDYWAEQPKHVLILAEKDTITGSIEEVVAAWGVTVYTLRGFASKTRAHDIGVACSEAAKAGKEVHILYLGDWDPSGLDIQRDVQQRILKTMLDESRDIGPRMTEAEMEERVRAGETMLAISERMGRNSLEREAARQVFTTFKVARVAILREDIRKFKLPPLRVKDTDSRTPGFVGKHGGKCVELDALPPNELRRRLTVEIRSRVDLEAWKRCMKVEEVEREFTRKVARAFRGLAAALPPRSEPAPEERVP